MGVRDPDETPGCRGVGLMTEANWTEDPPISRRRLPKLHPRLAKRKFAGTSPSAAYQWRKVGSERERLRCKRRNNYLFYRSGFLVCRTGCLSVRHVNHSS